MTRLFLEITWLPLDMFLIIKYTVVVDLHAFCFVFSLTKDYRRRPKYRKLLVRNLYCLAQG